MTIYLEIHCIKPRGRFNLCQLVFRIKRSDYNSKSQQCLQNLECKHHFFLKVKRHNEIHRKGTGLNHAIRTLAFIKPILLHFPPTPPLQCGDVAGKYILLRKSVFQIYNKDKGDNSCIYFLTFCTTVKFIGLILQFLIIQETESRICACITSVICVLSNLQSKISDQ